MLLQYNNPSQVISESENCHFSYISCQHLGCQELKRSVFDNRIKKASVCGRLLLCPVFALVTQCGHTWAPHIVIECLDPCDFRFQRSRGRPKRSSALRISMQDYFLPLFPFDVVSPTAFVSSPTLFFAELRGQHSDWVICLVPDVTSFRSAVT